MLLLGNAVKKKVGRGGGDERDILICKDNVTKA